MALTNASTLSPSLNPVSSKLSFVITDVTTGEVVHPSTVILICAITLSAFISSTFPIILFLTPASINKPPKFIFHYYCLL
ncbi:membrane protein [Clostridium sp. L74]|nr:membrane protein [Clostridium sp. L74]